MCLELPWNLQYDLRSSICRYHIQIVIDPVCILYHSHCTSRDDNSPLLLYTEQDRKSVTDPPHNTHTPVCRQNETRSRARHTHIPWYYNLRLGYASLYPTSLGNPQSLNACRTTSSSIKAPVHVSTSRVSFRKRLWMKVACTCIQLLQSPTDDGSHAGPP